MQKITEKNKTVKFISFILIVTMLAPAVLFSRPHQVNAFAGVEDTVNPGIFWSIIIAAQNVVQAAIEGSTAAIAGSTATSAGFDAAEFTWRTVFKEFLMAAARNLLRKMTLDVINWINNGFHGSPLFLQNPGSFFKDIAKYEIKTLIDLTGYNSIEFPFGKDFALNIISSYKRQFADNARYSLSKVMTGPDLKRYREDFDFGGWNGFLVNTQYPQNNYIGYQILATEELARRLEGTVTNNVQKVRDTLQQGMGFLSPKECPSNPLYNNGKNEFLQPSFHPSEVAMPPDDVLVDRNNFKYYYEDGTFNETEYQKDLDDAKNTYYQNAVNSQKNSWAVTSSCPGGLVATTPGSVVADQVMTALSSKFRETELGTALGSNMAAILDALLNQLTTLVSNKIGSGLSSLGGYNPPYSIDDWNYDSNTLGGPTIPGGPTDNTQPPIPPVVPPIPPPGP